MKDVEKSNSNIARSSFASNTAYDLGENNEITNTNADLNIRFNSVD